MTDHHRRVRFSPALSLLTGMVIGQLLHVIFNQCQCVYLPSADMEIAPTPRMFVIDDELQPAYLHAVIRDLRTNEVVLERYLKRFESFEECTTYAASRPAHPANGGVIGEYECRHTKPPEANRGLLAWTIPSQSF